MSDCAIIPAVSKDKDSKLFKDLLTIFNQDRVKAKDIYLRAINPTSKIRFKEAGIKFDENNEPLFSELYMKTDLRKSHNLPMKDLQKKLNMQIGHYKKGEDRPALTIMNNDNYNKLAAKASAFNRENPFKSLFVATVETVRDYESPRDYYNIHIVPRTPLYSKQARDLEYNESLNKKLTDILESHGVGIGALNDLEQRMKVNGVADFNTAKRTAEGLVEIIRLAEGTIGKAVLPEEFAHFILKALGKQPLADRFIKLIHTNGLASEILGESYQEYSELYNGDEAKLAEEAAGQLLAKHLLQAEKIPTKPYKGLLERLISYIKDFFKKFSVESIQRAMNDANKDAGRLAKEILSGHLDNDISLSNIGESGVFYSTTKTLNKIDELLRKIIDNENRRYIVYNSRGKRNFNAKQQDFIMELVSKLHSNESKLGVTRFLENTNEIIGQVNNRLKELVDTPPASMNDYALVLRDVRNYIYSYDNILKEMKSSMREAAKGEFSDDIKKSIDDTLYFLGNLKLDYTELAKPLFTQFIKAYFGDSKVIPFGKHKGEVITAEKLADLDVKDIGFFDRWLDSMASSSSYIANAMDASVKEARNQARLSTIEIQKQLQKAALELESSGIKGFEWMFEKNKDGKKTGNYISEEDAKKLSPAQKKFYTTIMEMKGELDKLLPDDATKLRSAVKIRKDLIERVKGTKDIKSGAKEFWESIKDGWIKRGDDTEFGEDFDATDFEGNKIMKLPIFYLKMRKGESMEDLSTDIVSTMTAYAAMVNDYNAMNKVINILELSRDMVRDAAGTGGMMKAQNLIKRINDFFEMQVYGRYIKDEGTIGDSKIEVAKVTNKLNAYTAISKMAFSLLSGISNVATGNVQMWIEGAAKQFFRPKDIFVADKTYSKHMPALLGELGSRVKTNKLSLWGELFNVQQDYDTKTKEVNFDRKTWFSKMFSSNTLFFMNNSGEHWMAYRTSLALASAYKMKSPDGKTVSLWDAMEVEYLDPNNKKRGARLVVKKGYLKEDGTEFSEEDRFKFEKKCASLNQKMHGVYNKADRDAFQKISIGRMVMMFRKYMKESLNRRYQSLHYDDRFEEWTEGYYRTTGRFILQCMKDLREGQFALVANWKNLDNREKQNIRRAIMELGHVLVLAAALAILDRKDDDDDKPWLLSMLEYQARRLYTEVGSLSPGLQMPGEALKLMKQPAAAVSSMETLLDLFGLMNPYNYEAVGGEDALIKSGKYKGHNKAYKLFFDALPWQPLYKGLHPAESIPFYKQ